MEGEKKYSPPFGTTQVWKPRESELATFCGSAPVMFRGPSLWIVLSTWPMRGSKPGSWPGGAPGGKLTALAQPVRCKANQHTCPRSRALRNGVYLLFWRNWNPLSRLLW